METLTWHCCVCCNPTNRRVDIEERLASKPQLHGLEWNESLSADWYQCSTKPKLFNVLWSQTYFFQTLQLSDYFNFCVLSDFDDRDSPDLRRVEEPARIEPDVLVHRYPVLPSHLPLRSQSRDSSQPESVMQSNF